MARQSNAAPVIIKRKKIVAGGGHHGGAWKVAYADFVTAMMAFFMLMWLLNATTEKQRKGLADYFNPTIPVNRISGGGDGAFGGDSVFSEETLARNGTGASSMHATEESQARGETGTNRQAETQAAERQQAEVDKLLTARGGESMTMERLLRHVITRVTDEGLVIEIFDLPDAPLFDALTAEPTAVLTGLSPMLSDVLGYAANPVAVQAHVRALPVTLAVNPVWTLSADRAMRARLLLESGGLPAARVARVTGFADRRPVTPDPAALRNNRIELVLLRRDR
ncbi:MAG TPA: flagellar motor protein MotB [Paracoccaceae bacterium]|nr:flagellar motor protein MotB [Paracoccaceae bacterium]HMO70201.1 flagellar motor protein MotB [Paracoccaceae bacterium]